MTGVRWVKVLEGRFEEDSVRFDNVFDVKKSLDEHMFVIIWEFCIWLGVLHKFDLFFFRLVKNCVDSITESIVIDKPTRQFIFAN